MVIHCHVDELGSTMEYIVAVVLQSSVYAQLLLSYTRQYQTLTVAVAERIIHALVTLMVFSEVYETHISEISIHWQKTSSHRLLH